MQKARNYKSWQRNIFQSALDVKSKKDNGCPQRPSCAIYIPLCINNTSRAVCNTNIKETGPETSLYDAA